jgi:secernin
VHLAAGAVWFYVRGMCDTLFVPSTATRAGAAIFGKNSDRNPEEPQVMTLVSGPRWPLLLSRPVWMRGAEMGINARGVVIGNEAVFSRWKPASDGVLGMDILRQALEEAPTATEAVDFIGHFTETHAQGGNGAYKGKLFYDNSYLVADFTGAWIIETAGQRWAARRLTAPGAISNCYSITDDFERSDPVTAAERKPGYSWRRRVSRRIYDLITHGDFRRACSLSRIGSSGATLETVFSALRSHGPRVTGTKSLCMHGGGLVNNATTSSMVVELHAAERRAVIWFTASPMPCVSLYRPAILENGSFCPLWKDYDYAEGSPGALEYWKQRRRATSLPGHGGPPDARRAEHRDVIQEHLLGLAAARSGPAADADLAREISISVGRFEQASAGG